MSDFDKYVAQWVSRACNDLSKDDCRKLLRNIHESLDDYEVLRDPAAARARKEAAAKEKQRREEKNKKAERLAHEEQYRKRQERQAHLPPLSPSKSNAETTLGGAAGSAEGHGEDLEMPKKKSSTHAACNNNQQWATVTEPSHGNDVGLLGTTPSRKSGRGSQKIPYSRMRASKVAKGRQAEFVRVKNIDFTFGECVEMQLRKLEEGKPTASTPNSATNRLRSAAVGGTVKSTLRAAESHVDPTPTALSATNGLKAGRKRSSPPPPLEDVVAEEKVRAEEEAEAAEKTRALRDTGDISEGNSAPSFGTLNSYQERLNSFHFASATKAANGNIDGCRCAEVDDTEEEEEDDAEEEFIDDREDARRRTMQMQRPSRPAISDSTIDIDEARIANFPTTPKSQNKVKTISRVLVRHFLFSTLDDSDIAKFASIMDLERFEAGENILIKGEPNDTFYIVLNGEAETTEANDAGEEVVVSLIHGSTCGDVALMYEFRNEATVVARTAVECASLQRRTYKLITSRAMEEKRKRYIDFLSSISIFDGLSPSELEHIAERLKEDVFVEGQKLIAYGVPNHWLHLVMEGTLSVMSPNVVDGEEREVAVVRRGCFVGEIEFIYHHLPVASVYAASPVVRTAKLSRRSFEVLPSSVREELVRRVEEDTAYSLYHNRMRSASPPAFDMTPPFDAPSQRVQRSMLRYKSEL
ncbi:regulatory subunit of protein kinase a-like protein [Leptomonas seymouri]|uniref:Regulatory subunit of protein kinase a-like protein n=1 Tax=Leptomonas seymouri TaxID=5684 RepID=A0A0N1PC94_LEPSE|nr:regulatory subunit of protein kinase a-like protein [Leptomonas seymouri]|eukprot:KPI83480.1 regulatory subunit of protein kinase a-like protein [Leptomonas seymouri]